MNNGHHDGQFQRLAGLLEELEQQSDPATRARCTEMLRAVLDFHAAGMQRMLELIFDTPAQGQDLIDTLARDPAVSTLLALHDLHPDDLVTRVQRALETVQPYLASHSGRVELLNVSPEGQVQLRLEGSCHGCPSSRMTLQNSIEQAIYAAAPEITGIEVEGLVEEPTPGKASEFVQLNTNVGPTQRLAADAAALA